MAKSYELEGIREVLNALDSLPPRVVQNIVTAVGRVALKENLIAPLRAGIPYTSILKKKDIAITYDKRDKALFAGPTSDAWRLRFVEHGTVARYVETRKGKKLEKKAFRGAIAPTPIAIRIVQNSPDDIIEFFNTRFGEEVEKQLEKRLKKYRKS